MFPLALLYYKNILQRIRRTHPIDLEDILHSGEEGNGSRGSGSSNNRHNSDHGKASVVELGVLFALQLVSRNSGHVNCGEDDSGKSSTVHVVNLLGLGNNLGDQDGEKDLGLSGIRNGIPGLEGLHFGNLLEGNIAGEHSREVDSVGLSEETNEGNHGNTGVLELGSTEPLEGGVGTSLGQSKRIEALGRHGASWQLIERRLKGGAGLKRRGSEEGLFVTKCKMARESANINKPTKVVSFTASWPHLGLGGRGESGGRSSAGEEESGDLHSGYCLRYRWINQR